MENIMIRQLDINTDGEPLYKLWDKVLGDMWRIKKDVFLKTIESGGVEGSYAAIKEGVTVGFVITKIGKKGEVMVIMVDKKWQRQGIGTELMTKAVEYFKANGISEIQLGAGANPYLWPGVPDSLSHAISFFEKLGWEYDEESLDMVGDLGGYVTPAEIFRSINELGINLVIANKTEEKEIIEFEKANFSQWVKYFESALAGESGEEVLIAIDRNNEILGTALVGKKPIIWNEILGNKVGTMGALGVKESARGQGIGMAMAAKATEMLKEEGLDKSYLGWTWLVDWYGKLGYKVWRKYKMSYKRL